MCGINGILSKTNIDPLLINRMNNCIIHRGPDGEGVFCRNNIQLGMRRLSIIDLSTGNQPIFSEDNRYVIVFNGEIYNYNDLREGLVARGHHFSTNSDTEVIIHLYEEKKEACLQDLNGMFAFAVYDTLEKNLFIARDRLGKKPLYYCFDTDRFYFASELKSILEVIGRKFTINREALESYFTLTFIPAPMTIFNGICKLESGCAMHIKQDLSFHVFRYWDLAERAHTVPVIKHKQEAIEVIRNLLFDAVEKRMIADVPLGAFLSGGVDSSIIVNVMSHLSRSKVKTYSIGNTLSCYDESEKARRVANLFKTEHTEWMIDNNHICSIIDTVLDNFDEPFGDSSAIPSFVVSELACKHVKVILTGDGGDELFAGYERYLIYKYLSWYRKIPGTLRSVIKPALNSLPYPAALSLLINKAKKIVNNDGENSFEQYHAMQRLGFSEQELSMLSATIPLMVKDRVKKTYCALEKRSDLARAQFCDIAIGLEGDMLVKVDRTTMQNSIEARSPFLDFRLLEASFGIADDLKLQGWRLKAILKDAFKDEFPKGFFEKQKMGFGIPIGEFLKNELRSAMEQFLAIDELWVEQGMNIQYIRELFALHCQGNRQTFKLWPLYVFARWLQKSERYIDFTK